MLDSLQMELSADSRHALLVSFIGFFITLCGNLDREQDELEATSETQDSFDFIVGKISFQSHKDRRNMFASKLKKFFPRLQVGAGSAGAVVANRLSKQFKVLLLEAGGEPNPLQSIPAFDTLMLQQPLVDWNFTIEPQKHACFAMKNNVSIVSSALDCQTRIMIMTAWFLQQVRWARGKSLGGSSSLNFLMYTRGHPKDFDNWANLTGDSRWNYENVLPFFKKSEDYQGEYQNGMKITKTWPQL